MSYTPLKTINGQSIKGTGDLTVTGSGAAWGSITGTLSSQTDLQSELDGKLDLDGGNANTDIDIDTYSFNAKSLHCKGTGGAGHLGLKHQSGSITASTSESTLGADSSGNPVWKNDGNPIQNVMLENAAITGATKTKITYDSKGLVTSGADATTADIADSTNKRYVTDAQLTVIGNTSGTNTGDQTSIVGISGTKSQFDTACTDGNFLYVGDVVGLTDGDKGDITVSSSGTVWNIDAATIGTTELSATGTPDNTTFLRGDNTWATPTAADPSGWTTIVKSANQDVTNNSTPQDDTDLQFSVVAGGYYMVEMNVCYSGNDTTGDYRFILELSTGLMRGTGHFITMSTTSAITTLLITATNSLATGNNAIGVFTSNLDHLQALTIYYNFYVDSNATFKYKFANSSSAIGRTSRTNKGSILRYKKIN